ncbi:hypothetical protein F3Y22_tig00109925pilonHSYRG00091 [Hibiscus syriacus]|uniref:hAT-like transposase RNase-H fold domain-containing protein n=1 Tax=Hibiscus syriacus TaxID=106335 RepID=A0A6A3BVE8_HIBSY|nr:hypothetical protein F3Y22_tig00109925pilonHSYRG00091 [Hibiscus syriacus]
MEGQRSIDDNSKEWAQAQAQSQVESNNMTQSSPMRNNQGPSISPIEEEQTQSMIAMLVPSRNTLKNDILKIYDFEKEKTMRLLEKNRSKIAITTDMWTSSNQKKVYKDVFKRLKQREAQYRSLPTDRDWELASSICGKLQLFYKVTLMFSGTKYPTANVFFPSICEIRIALSKWSEDRDEVIKAMGERMLVKFDKYWSVIHGVMGVAVVLVSRLFQDYETCNYESSQNRDVDSSRNTSDMEVQVEGGFFNDYFTFIEDDNHTGIMSELDHYLQRNTSGRLVSPHRSRLHPKTLEALMCAQSWLINEIRATCSQESEAYCKSIEYDRDDGDELRKYRLGMEKLWDWSGSPLLLLFRPRQASDTFSRTSESETKVFSISTIPYRCSLSTFEAPRHLSLVSNGPFCGHVDGALVFRVNSPGPATSSFTFRIAARITENSVITVSLGRVPRLGFSPTGQSLLSEIPSVENSCNHRRMTGGSGIVIKEHVLEFLFTMSHSEEADNPVPKSISNLVVHITDTHVDHLQDVVTKLEMELEAVELQLDRGGFALKMEMLDDRRFPKMHLNLQRLLQVISHGEQVFPLVKEKCSSKPWFSSQDINSLEGLIERLRRLKENVVFLSNRVTAIQTGLNTWQSEQINKKLYYLSFLSIVFLPLSVITGVFGMNVGGVPWTMQNEPEVKDGFINVMILCLAMLLLVLLCFLFPPLYTKATTWYKKWVFSPIEWFSRPNFQFFEEEYDKVSPYHPTFFVMIMERLGHAISTAVERRDRIPFRLVQGGLLVSHLFFDDDLILYAKASLDQAHVIDSILSDFGTYSGHKVNKLKSQVFSSSNRSEEIATAISNHLDLYVTLSKRLLDVLFGVTLLTIKPISHGGLRVRMLKNRNITFLIRECLDGGMWDSHGNGIHIPQFG